MEVKFGFKLQFIPLGKIPGTSSKEIIFKYRHKLKLLLEDHYTSFICFHFELNAT